MVFLRILCLLGLLTVATASSKVSVDCRHNEMSISMPVTNHLRTAYLKDLKDYPNLDCKFQFSADATQYFLNLSTLDQNIYNCGLTRVINKITNKRIYYHTIVIETSGDVTNSSEPQKKNSEVLRVKCSVESDGRIHTVVRRNVLPAGFQEPEYLEITSTFEKEAPKPELGVGVRQNGALVTGELNVSPGTPLQMEIFLDKSSAPIYGLLVTHMQVTDTKNQEETIIFNGCSVDPYLFDNFNTVDGDFLTAKFRAFKFPESTYVQFRGTVNVCLDKCMGIECSDGVTGYGRRRKRAFPSLPADPNKVFEITITSFIKVNYEDESDNVEDLFKNTTSKLKNKKLIVGNQMKEKEDNRLSYKTPEEKPLNLGKAVINEEIQYTAIIADTSSSNVHRPTQPIKFVLLLLLLVAYFY